jgi:isopentenyl-diphosphate delta-isomerase
MEEVILVDSEDKQVGTEEKMKAHQDPKLHRAFSVFIVNPKGEMMIQRRALGKYHCPGLWTNTCCSHPRPGEDTEDAAHRRLKEEMGFDCDLKEIFTFTYKAEFDNGLTEHEFDHVFLGECDKEPSPDTEEVEEWKWIEISELREDMKENPERYTPWFIKSLDGVVSYLEEHGKPNQD